MSAETIASPGIGDLDLTVGFSEMGGAIIDLKGANGNRATAQIRATAMFKGWHAGSQPTSWPLASPPDPWLVVGQTTFDGAALGAYLGGSITAANIRITLADGDSGSPNPVYTSMFGSYTFPYIRATSQPVDYDFDGGNNLWLGFEDDAGNPVQVGYMGAQTTYRLDTNLDNYDTFVGFPGIFALTDPYYSAWAKPAHYMTPVQAGVSQGVWPATGWFAVPGGALSALYDTILTGRIKIGINDALSAGDQYYDFTLGLGGDVLNIPIIVTPSEPAPLEGVWLDLWVWRELNRFSDLDDDLNFPPGYGKALLYALMLEMLTEYPAAAERYDFEELMADTEGAVKDLDLLNASNAEAMEPPV